MRARRRVGRHHYPAPYARLLLYEGSAERVVRWRADPADSPISEETRLLLRTGRRWVNGQR